MKTKQIENFPKLELAKTNQENEAWFDKMYLFLNIHYSK